MNRYKVLVIVITLSVLAGALSACRNRVHAEGQVEGKFTFMSMPTDGAVSSIIQTGAFVKKGQLLYHFCPKLAKSCHSVYAPHEGKVYNVYVKDGQPLKSGAVTLAFLPRYELFVVFYLDREKQEKLHLNDIVNVYTQDTRPIKAMISYISYRPSQLPVSLSNMTQMKEAYYRIEATPLIQRKVKFRHLAPGKTVEVDFNL